MGIILETRWRKINKEKKEKDNNTVFVIYVLATIAVCILCITTLILSVGIVTTRTERECIQNNSSWLEVIEDGSHFRVCVTNKAIEEGFKMIGRNK